MGFMDSIRRPKNQVVPGQRALNTNSDPQGYRHSWLNQALTSNTNTHWGFGTTGLPQWAIGNQKTVYDIFQVRANASREIMEIVREHLRSDSIDQYQRSLRIIQELEDEFDADQIASSRAAIDLHAKRNLAHLSESLSKRREWLVENQPSEVEALTMRLEKRRFADNSIPHELQSEDDQDGELKDPSAPHKPTTKRPSNVRKRNRPNNDKSQDADQSWANTHGGTDADWSVATRRRRRRRRPNSLCNSESTPTSGQHPQTGGYDYSNQGYYADQKDNANSRGRPGNRTRGQRPFRRGQRGNHSSHSMESSNWHCQDPGPDRVRGRRPYTNRRQPHRD